MTAENPRLVFVTAVGTFHVKPDGSVSDNPDGDAWDQAWQDVASFLYDMHTDRINVVVALDGVGAGTVVWGD